jgi:hypothetical protein
MCHLQGTILAAGGEAKNLLEKMFCDPAQNLQIAMGERSSKQDTATGSS